MDKNRPIDTLKAGANVTVNRTKEASLPKIVIGKATDENRLIDTLKTGAIVTVNCTKEARLPGRVIGEAAGKKRLIVTLEDGVIETVTRRTASAKVAKEAVTTANASPAHRPDQEPEHGAKVEKRKGRLAAGAHPRSR